VCLHMKVLSEVSWSVLVHTCVRQQMHASRSLAYMNLI